MSLQGDIHKVLDQLSNNECDELEIDDSWIEEAGGVAVVARCWADVENILR